MKKIALVLFILSLFSSSCIAQGIEDEEYEVYSAVLAHMNLHGSLVMQENTCDRYALDHKSISQLEQRSRQALDKDLVEDFNSKNKVSIKLQNKFKSAGSVTLITKEELAQIFSDITKGWEEFYRRYPKSSGNIEFSRVGFNKAKTKAVVYFGRQYHNVAGSGAYILLVKENGNWKVLVEVGLWIS